MRLLHSLARTSASFDDPNLVSHAGLAPVMALAQRAGLGQLAAELIRPGGECGVNAHLKVPCLVAGMAAGADGPHDTRRGRAVPGDNPQFRVRPWVLVRVFPRHLRRAAAHGGCAVAKPGRSALAGGPVLRRPGSRPAADILRTSRVLYMLPFAAAMVLLAARIWPAAALPASQPRLEPTGVPV